MTIRSDTGNVVTEDWLRGQPGVTKEGPSWVLECSSAGDQRFSAFYAVISVYGNRNSIESHYQDSKLFTSEDEDGPMLDKFDEPILRRLPKGLAKGKLPAKIQVGDLRLDASFLSMWYDLLWVKYLDDNPRLVLYLSNFQVFRDKFDKHSMNSQARTIARYMKDRTQLMNECKPLFDILKQQAVIERQYEEEHDV